MVIKLVKNEIKATAKSFLPVLIMTIIGAVLSVIIGFQMKDVASGLELTTFGSIFLGVSMLVIYAMIIASVVLTYKAIIDMLYKGIYKKSAYRLFTYPASSTEIFIAKTITASFWSLVSFAGIFAIYFGAISIFFIDASMWRQITQIFSFLFGAIFEGNATFASFLIVVGQFTQTILWVTVLLFAGSIANSSRFRNNRGLLTFVLFIGIYFLISILSNLMLPGSGFDIISIENGTGGGISNSYQVISLIKDVIFIIISGVGTIWFWNNKLEILN